MNSIESIKDSGFIGFVKISELQRSSDYKNIPKAHGVYLILRMSDTTPVFLAENPSRLHAKHRKHPAKHSYAIDRLQTKWEKVKTSIVIYIGKAGGGKHQTTLYHRLKGYLEAGRTQPGHSSHSGGRAIWQLQDSADLLVCWKASDGEDAIELERRMITEFKAQYDSFPLANWRR